MAHLVCPVDNPSGPLSDRSRSLAWLISSAAISSFADRWAGRFLATSSGGAVISCLIAEPPKLTGSAPNLQLREESAVNPEAAPGSTRRSSDQGDAAHVAAIALVVATGSLTVLDAGLVPMGRVVGP
jgi:hypothetical protein